MMLEQQTLAKRLVLTDAIEESNLLAAASVIYSHDMIISVIIVYDTKEQKVIEKRYCVEKAKFSYHKEFVGYRDSAVMMKTFQLLKNKPSIIFVEGEGICHPRRMGVASYFGLLVDRATIGISTNHLFGKIEGDAVYDNKEILAKIIETKERANPIYVSQGNKISLSTALEITKRYLKGNKLPEPLYLAHKYAAKIRSAVKDEITGRAET